MFESGCFLRESSRFFNVVYGLFFISFFHQWIVLSIALNTQKQTFRIPP